MDNGRSALPDSSHERAKSSFASAGGRNSHAGKDHHGDEIEELCIQPCRLSAVDNIVIRWPAVRAGQWAGKHVSPEHHSVIQKPRPARTIDQQLNLQECDIADQRPRG